MRIHCRFLASALGLLGALGVVLGSPEEEIVARWLETNANLNTLRVEFNQTRRLNSLKVPIREPGVIWLDHPGKRFRWQTGDPPKTIVTRQGEELLIVRPNEKKFERRPAEAGRVSGIAVLAKGFPRSMAEFRRQYRLLEVNERRETFRIVAQPLDQAARGVSAFTFVVGSGQARLQGIDIAFRDGSTQQIDFTKAELDAPLPADLFTPDLTGFQATKF